MAARYWVGGSGNWDSTSRWSASSGGASGASVPTTSDNVIFDSNSSSSNSDYTVSFPSGLAASTTSIDITGSALVTFDFSPGGTLSCSSLSISVSTTSDGLRLIDSTTTRSALYCSGTTTLTQGLLNLNGYRMTTSYFTSTNTNTRSIAFGSTGSILLPGVNGNVTTWNTQTDTNLTLSGSKNVFLQANFSPGSSTRYNYINLSTTTSGTHLFNFTVSNILFDTYWYTYIQYQFTTGSGTPTMNNFTLDVNNNNTYVSGSMTIYGTTTIQGSGYLSGNPVCVGAVTMTGGGIIGNPTAQSTLNITSSYVSGIFYVHNNVVMNSGANINTLYFTSTATLQTLTTSANLTNLTIDKTSGTVQLQQATTVSGATTLTQGTFNINGYTLTTIYFLSSNSNTRTIAFGTTGSIVLSGINANVTAWDTGTITGLTISGSKNVFMKSDVGMGSSTRYNYINLNSTTNLASMFNFTLNGILFDTYWYTYIQYSFTSPSGIPSVQNFTCNNTYPNSNLSPMSGNVGVFGDVSIVSGFLSGTINFYGSSNQSFSIATNNFVYGINVEKSGGTLTFNSNIGLVGGYTFTLTSGSVNLNNYQLTTSYFTSTNTNTRSIAFGSTGSILLPGVNGSVTTWNTQTDTNLTLSGSKNVFLQSNFSPGSSTRYNYINLSSTTSGTHLFNFTVSNIFFDSYWYTYIQYQFTNGASQTPAMDGLTVNVGGSFSTNIVVTCQQSNLNIYGPATLTSGVLSTTPYIYGVFTINGGTMSGTAYIYNNFNFSSGSITTVYFTGTQATQTLTSSVSISNLTIDKTSGSVQLQQSTTITGTTQLIRGTLDLNNYTLTTPYFLTSNSNIRAISFGTGTILLPGVNGNVTTWDTSNDTNLTISGSKNVSLQANISPGSSTRYNYVNLNNGTTLAKLFNFNVNNIFFDSYWYTYIQYSFTAPSGSPTMDTFTMNVGGALSSNVFVTGNIIAYNTSGTSSISSGFLSANPVFYGLLNITGGGISGNATAYENVTISNGSVSSFLYLYKNLSMSTGGSVGTSYFTGTQATQTLTTSVNLTNLTIDKTSGTVQLQQATTVTGSTTVTQGTFNINGYTLTTGYFLSSNSNTRTIAFGATGGVVLSGINGNVTVVDFGTVTGLTITGTKNITLQSNISPGSSTRYNYVNLNNGSDTSRMFNFTVGNILYDSYWATYIQYSFTAPSGTGSVDSFTYNNTATSFESTPSSGNIGVYGNASFLSSYLSGQVTFYGSSNQTISQTAANLFNIIVEKSGGTLTLNSNITQTSGYTFQLTSGSVNLNNYSFATSYFTSSNTNTRSIAFGSTGSIILRGVNGNVTTWNTDNVTNLTLTGSKNVSLQSNFSPGSSTRYNYITINSTSDSSKTFNFNVNNIFFDSYWYTYIQYQFTASAGNPTMDNLTVNVGGSFSTNIFVTSQTSNINVYGPATLTSGVLSLSNGYFYGILTINGGTMSGNAFLYNNLIFTSGSITTAYFTGTQAVQTLTTSVSISNFTIDKTSGSVQLQQSTSITGTTQLIRGTLDLNNYTLNTYYFSSSNSNTRAIAFGVNGSIILPGVGNNVTTWDTGTDANLTITGSKNIFLQGNFSTGSSTRYNYVNIGTNTTLANSFNFTFNNLFFDSYWYTTLRYQITTPSGTPYVDSLSMTGNPSFLGYMFVDINPGSIYVYGDLIIDSIGSGGNFNLLGDKTQLTRANTTVFSGNLLINKTVNTAVELNGAFTTSGYVSLTQGILNLQSYTITSSYFTSSNSNTRTVNLAFGNWALTSSGTVWDMATSTNALVKSCGSSTLYLTNNSTTARTFNGGSLKYGNIDIGGPSNTSTTTFTGSNTFKTMSSSKSVAHTVTFTAGTTTTLVQFTISGNSSFMPTINSTTSTRAILRKNSLWLVGANSSNAGNNVGLTFTTDASNPINYLSFNNIEGVYVIPSASAKTNFWPFFY